MYRFNDYINMLQLREKTFVFFFVARLQKRYSLGFFVCSTLTKYVRVNDTVMYIIVFIVQDVPI